MLIIAGLLFMGKHLYELKRMDNTVEKKQPATVTYIPSNRFK